MANEQKPAYVAGPWQLAIAVLGRWQTTFAAVFVILLLGWPTMVIFDLGQRTGWWGSLSAREQTNRQEEHAGQTSVLRGMATTMESVSETLVQVNEALTDHNAQSLRKDDIIAYLVSEDCEAVNLTPFQAKRCKRLQAFLDQYAARAQEEHGH